MNMCEPTSISLITVRVLVAVYVIMEKKNILAYFSDFSLKTESLFFFFFCFSCKEEGICDKVIGLISLSLYTASEHLIVLVV